MDGLLGLLLPPPYSWEHSDYSFIVGADPAAGVQFTRLLKGDAAEVLVGVSCAFTASATVATRTVVWEIREPDNQNSMRIAAPRDVTAGQVVAFHWGLGVQGFASAGSIQAQTSIPMMALLPGFSWRLDAFSLQVGDQFSSIRFYIRRFFTENSLEPGAGQ